MEPGWCWFNVSCVIGLQGSRNRLVSFSYETV